MENNDSSSNSSSDDIIDRVFFKKYHCIKKLGEGSFGRIYEGVYNNEHFALKFEDTKTDSNLLESEAGIMNYLKSKYIPSIHSFGRSGDYNILIMQLMGQSLEDLINIKKTFPIKTVCLLGYQMINILEFIHNKHIVHRDLKPDNFVMGLNESAKNVHLLDFGLAKKYRSSVTLKHYPLINKKKLTGTARYASINALKGYEQSRRDDLESAGYVLMYFLKGALPWQGIPGKTKDERYKKILQKKMDTSAEVLCEGFPEEFRKYIEYTRNLDYEETPDYENLRDYFLNVLEKQNEDLDYIYIWSTEQEKILRKKEYLEEKEKEKRKKYSNKEVIKDIQDFAVKRNYTSKTNSVTYLPTKVENFTTIQNNQNNNQNVAQDGEKEKEKAKRRRIRRDSTLVNYNNRDIEAEQQDDRNDEMKINYKYQTNENSAEDEKVNKNKKVLNSPEKSRKGNKSRTHNNYKRKSTRGENNELKKENEEICCTEACTIF